MKPKITRCSISNEWRCIDSLPTRGAVICGWGGTPMDAYGNWLKRKELYAC